MHATGDAHIIIKIFADGFLVLLFSNINHIVFGINAITIIIKCNLARLAAYFSCLQILENASTCNCTSNGMSGRQGTKSFVCLPDSQMTSVSSHALGASVIVSLFINSFTAAART